MNSWSMTANIGRDCEQKFTTDGTSIVSFSVAVKSGYGDRASVTWVKCSIFGSRGASLKEYLNKGQLVGIVGEVTNREWTDKEGAKRLSLEVRVNELTLLGRRDDSGVQEPRQAPQQPQQSAQPAASQSASLADMGDDVPF